MNHVQQPGRGRVQVQSPAHRATWAVKLWEHVEPLGDHPVSCGNGQALMEGAVVLLRPFQQLSWAFWASVSLGENCPTVDPLQVPGVCVPAPVLVSLCCREGSGSSSSPAQAPPPSASSSAFSELFHPALSCAMKNPPHLLSSYF